MAFIDMIGAAKINLSLDVLKKREDGYHELKMIMQTVGLHDTIHIETADMGIRVSCNHKDVPSGMENIALKAAFMITGQYSIKSGLRIHIDKKIPLAAGLAGGSADAAAVLNGIDRMFSMDLTSSELRILAKKLGADVPYCLVGGTMLAQGIGEILSPLKTFAGVHIVLLKPKIEVSTAWVYENFDLSKVKQRPDTALIIEAINAGDIRKVAANMINVLESVTIPNYPIVQRAKDKLMEHGAIGSMMSGSGPSVFGLFESKEAAEEAFNAVTDKRWDKFLTYTR